MGVLRVFLRIVIGLLFGAVSAVALSPLLASVTGEETAGPAVLIVLATVVLISAAAPTFRRCLGRGMLCLGTALFMLPLSTLVLSGVAVSETVGSAATDAEMAGAALGGALAGGVLTGLAGLVGFFLGGVFLFLGGVFLLFGLILSLGGRREVVVYQA